MTTHPQKLNLFALPSQTTLLFAGILTTLGLPLLLSSLSGRFLALLPLLPLVVFLFTLWDFLAEPQRFTSRLQAKPATALPEPLRTDATTLQQMLDEEAAAIGRKTAPRVLVARGNLPYPVAFGTWRRHFIVFPAKLTPKLAAGTTEVEQRPLVQVLLRHELAHFVNQDVWLARFALSFLKLTVFACLAYWFALIWQPVIYALGRPLAEQVVPMFAPLLVLLPPEVQEIMADPPPMTWNWAVNQVLELNMALLPILLGAMVLWYRDWQLLMRVREFYADARVASWLGDLKTLQAAQDRFGPDLNPSQSKLRTLWQQLHWPAIRPSPQPEIEERREVLEHPEAAYGEPRQLGVRAGLIVLLFYLIFASLLAPMREGIGAEVALAFGFVILALGLTPGALARLPDMVAVRQQLRTALGCFVLIFNSVIAAALGFALIAATLRPNDLNVVMYAIAGVIPKTVEQVIDDPVGYVAQALIGSLLIFVVGAPLVLYWFLRLDLLLKRRLLTWYGAGWLARRSQAVFLGVSLTLGLLLWLGVAPLLSLIALPGILKPTLPYFLSIGSALVVATAGGLFFWRLDRRYRGRCAACRGKVSSEFMIGAVCPHCGAALQPWLTAEY